MSTRGDSAGIDRVRVLEGSHNVRDLGGLVTGDGQLVRTGRVFRSDYPTFAVVADGAAIRDLGLRTVVDLRRGFEADAECVSWSEHGVDYHRCPITAAGGEASWSARYRGYLAQRPETVVEAVRRIANATGHPVLFHCAAGKDRTGVIAAVLLQLLGVSDEDIVADYLLSADHLAPVLARLSGIAYYAEAFGDLDQEHQRPQADHMNGFLQWLSGCGGAETWLLAHGVPREEIEQFRREMRHDPRPA